MEFVYQTLYYRTTDEMLSIGEGEQRQALNYERYVSCRIPSTMNTPIFHLCVHLGHTSVDRTGCPENPSIPVKMVSMSIYVCLIELPPEINYL